jgi:Carboxypeptidase regulatory-like domain
VTRSRWSRVLAGGPIVAAVLAAGCPRDRGHNAAPNASSANLDTRDVRCVERPEGCVWCEGRGPAPPLVDPDAVPATLCNPTDQGDCVDFCTRLAPECAVSWRTVPSCLLPSEQEFRREVIRRDTADRPEAVVQGRVTDEAGKRIEGAKISVWFQGTSIAEEVSGKDGSFHLRLRTGPWTYFVRVSRPTLATEIADLRIEKPGTTVHNFRLAPENVIRGRVLSSKGEPIRGATVHAVRNAEDPVASGEAQSAEDGAFAIGGLDSRRYFVRASKFGWLPETLKWAVTAPAKGVGFKLTRTGVIEGKVVDTDGEGQANATVVALLSPAFGATTSPIIWRVDGEGKFAQDRFQTGTYYLWARHGEMLVYPPEKIEITDQELDAEIELRLVHKGARVRGNVATSTRAPIPPDARTVLVGRSPLALPRKAVGEMDRDGKFVVGTLLPGRYEISVRVGPRILQITSGPREVEVPIDPGATVDLPETIVVRPQVEE